ncbi:hypothetical protein LINPERPRIM_LOCUS36423 [Linum perenne]
MVIMIIGVFLWKIFFGQKNIEMLLVENIKSLVLERHLHLNKTRS